MSLSWKDLLLVALGGALGSSARYLVGKAMGPTSDASVPWHTFAVNASGAFLLALLVVVAARSGWPSWWRPLIAVGVLGGYTTFSTFALEIVELALRGHAATAAAYAAGSLFAGIAGAGLGIAAGRAFA